MAHGPKHARAKAPIPASTPLRNPWLWTAITVALGALVIGWFTVSQTARIGSVTPGAGSQAPGLDLRLEDERSVFRTYAGSAACRDCHKEAYESWAVSNHGLAER